MTILAALNAYEAEGERLNSIINKLGREVAATAGVDLSYERYYKSGRYEDYSYDSYERIVMCEFYDKHKKLPYSYTTAKKPEWWDDEEETVETGERLIAAKYGMYIGDGYNQTTVYFPESYLDDPNWQERERGYAAARQNQRNAEQTILAAEAEAKKRAQYLALKAEFGHED